jgi:phospholipid transport system transporter-binding protein
MTVATLETINEDNVAVQGDLDFHSITAVWDRIQKLPHGRSPLNVDLAQVGRSDSSGVALLVEWLRLAQARQQEIRFVNTPEQMRAIIRVAELDDLLPLQETYT